MGDYSARAWKIGAMEQAMKEGKLEEIGARKGECVIVKNGGLEFDENGKWIKRRFLRCREN